MPFSQSYASTTQMSSVWPIGTSVCRGRFQCRLESPAKWFRTEVGNWGTGQGTMKYYMQYAQLGPEHLCSLLSALRLQGNGGSELACHSQPGTDDLRCNSSYQWRRRGVCCSSTTILLKKRPRHLNAPVSLDQPSTTARFYNRA